MDFLIRLKKTGSMLAAARGKDSVDFESLWEAFLFLAANGEEDAARSLRDGVAGFDATQWSFPPLDAGSTQDLPWDREVLQLVGPLGPFGRTTEGVCTAANFFQVLRTWAAGQPRLLERLPAIVRLVLGDVGSSTSGMPTGSIPGAGKRQGPPRAGNPGTGIGSHRDTTEALRSALKASVTGQAAGLERLVEAFGEALARPASDPRPCGVMLLFGPRGSGKSTTVRAIGQWISRYRDSLPIKQTIHVDGPPQEAWKHVCRELQGGNGPAVIVVPSVENQHEVLIDAMLAEFDNSSTMDRDRGALRPATGLFRGCIVLFVGEVGAHFWAGVPFQEPTTLPSNDTIKYHLLHEQPTSVSNAPPRQRHCFVSALDSIDAFIPFRQMRANDVSRLLDRQCDALITELASRDTTLEIRPNARALITVAASYKQSITGQSVLSAFRRYIDGPVRKLIAGGCPGVVRVDCADAGFNRIIPRASPRIVVLDDEHDRVAGWLETAIGTACAVAGVATIEEAIASASARKPDLLFLDMWFFGQELWRNYLAKWRRAFPDVPVALFSSQQPPRIVREEIERLGGVIGFVSKHASQPSESLAPFLDHARWRAVFRGFQETYGYAGDQIIFDTFADCPDDRSADLRFENVMCVASEADHAMAPKVMLPPETEQNINEFVSLFLNTTIREALNVKRPRGLLLYGPPGNGKTLVARNLAAEMRCNFIAINAGDIRGRWAGMALTRLQEVYARACSRQPCVIFIDELEAIFPVRGDDSGGGVVRDDNATVAGFLAMLDGFSGDAEVFIIGATNRRDAIDPALLRPGRLDRHIEIGMPLVSQRRAMLQDWCRRNGRAQFDVEKAAQATYGMSGADVIRVADDSALLAFRRCSDPNDRGQAGAIAILDQDFQDAVDNFRLGPRRDTATSTSGGSQSRRRVAFHEAGHLVAGYRLLNRIPDRLTIVARGKVGGFVEHASRGEEDRDFPTKTTLIGEIACLLAGGAGEAMEYDEHSVGVSDDRRRARELVRMMVTEWGMGTTETEAECLFAGDRSAESAGPAAKAEAAAILKEAEALAIATLEKDKELVKMVAEAALEHEELGRDDICRLLGT